MTIRRYEAADRQACIAIFKSNMPQFFAPSELGDFEFWLDGQDAGMVVYREAMAEHYYVAEQDGSIVACGGFFIPKDSTMANMTWGMVDQWLHRQGIGSRMFRHRLQQIRTLYPGYAVSLDTTQYSYSFFEKEGFRVIKITNDFYAPGMHRYDMEIGE